VKRLRRSSSSDSLTSKKRTCACCVGTWVWFRGAGRGTVGSTLYELLDSMGSWTAGRGQHMPIPNLGVC
jgi:hypothetical protein